jgi:hypothetical protein
MQLITPGRWKAMVQTKLRSLATAHPRPMFPVRRPHRAGPPDETEWNSSTRAATIIYS